MAASQANTPAFACVGLSSSFRKERAPLGDEAGLLLSLKNLLLKCIFQTGAGGILLPPSVSTPTKKKLLLPKPGTGRGVRGKFFLLPFRMPQSAETKGERKGREETISPENFFFLPCSFSRGDFEGLFTIKRGGGAKQR